MTGARYRRRLRVTSIMRCYPIMLEASASYDFATQELLMSAHLLTLSPWLFFFAPSSPHMRTTDY